MQRMKTEKKSPAKLQDHYTTIEVANLLGMAVRSVQLMVDRNELDAWKTPGGHRRITRESVERWQKSRAQHFSGGVETRPADARTFKPETAATGVRVLLIEDSVHFQNLVSMVVRRNFPKVELQVASDGITGLALYGQIQPDVLIVDILLPGVDGATLITMLRSHEQFARSQLIVVTSLSEEQREPYAFALAGVTVIHKPQLVMDLPAALAKALAAVESA